MHALSSDENGNFGASLQCDYKYEHECSLQFHKHDVICEANKYYYSIRIFYYSTFRICQRTELNKKVPGQYKDINPYPTNV